jgi:hypothetical protein
MPGRRSDGIRSPTHCEPVIFGTDRCCYYDRWMKTLRLMQCFKVASYASEKVYPRGCLSLAKQGHPHCPGTVVTGGCA